VQGGAAVTREALAFVTVGVTALVTHWLVLVLAVSAFAVAPLVANVIGFAIAFNVSYFGHRRLTFAATDRPHRRTLPRFLGVALAVFAVNEALYAGLLAFTPLRYDIAHLLVLGTVAVATYVLSKFWAFA
jgi:putative flippase GtrA